jgi:hypothetical protein
MAEKALPLPLSQVERNKIDGSFEAYRRDPEAVFPWWPEVKEGILRRV